MVNSRYVIVLSCGGWSVLRDVCCRLVTLAVKETRCKVGFQYHHLQDSEVRDAMVAHWLAEYRVLSDEGSLDQCYGKQLTPTGWSVLETAMPEALRSHDDDWLVAEMSSPEYWMSSSPRRTKSGVTMVSYNKRDALERLVFGEFNIAYIRGLAYVLVSRGESGCLIYRANPAYEPRGECSTWEGQQFPLSDVISGHRARYYPPPGDRTRWSVPAGPNCHHSIRSVAT